MARIRNIKPEFFLNEDLADLSPETRLAFIGLWTLADQHGRLEDRPRRIRLMIFPYHPKTDIDRILCDLADRGFIYRYKVDGADYIEVVNFEKHQFISGKERNKPSTIPAPSQNEPGTIPELAQTCSGTSLEPIRDGSGTPDIDIDIDTRHRTQDIDNGAPAPAAKDDPIYAVFDGWNAVAKSDPVNVRLVPAVKLTKSRRDRIRKRIADPVFAEGWPKALGFIAKSRWHNGVNDSGWVADFDWFLKTPKFAGFVERADHAPPLMALPGQHVGNLDDVTF